MNTLETIGARHDTDKNHTLHNYLSIYARYFEPIRNKVLKILEIGINTGGSLRMWAEYFPNAKVYGADINPGTLFTTDRITTMRVDQSDRISLATLRTYAPYDIIIDDGSHLVGHQQTTWASCMPMLKPGGLYVIEDLLTSYCGTFHYPDGREFYLDRRAYNPDNLGTTLDVLKSWKTDKRIVSDYMTLEEQVAMNHQIASCTIELGAVSEIAFITSST